MKKGSIGPVQAALLITPTTKEDARAVILATSTALFHSGIVVVVVVVCGVDVGVVDVGVVVLGSEGEGEEGER